jgi:hypothetical protein
MKKFGEVAAAAIQDDIKLEFIVRHIAVEEGLIDGEDEEYDLESIRDKVFEIVEKRTVV